MLGFSIYVGSCLEFPRAGASSLALSLHVAEISVSVTVACDEDVGEVDEEDETRGQTKYDEWYMI